VFIRKLCLPDFLLRLSFGALFRVVVMVTTYNILARTHYILQISMPGCRDHSHIVLVGFVLIQFPLAMADSSQQAPTDSIVAIQVKGTW
jgi:hypothetical protein